LGRRRGEAQILMEILSSSLNGVKVTSLMYRANLSYSTLRRYLAKALDRGLICNLRDEDGHLVYKITDKGKNLLNRLREVDSILRG